MASAKKKSGIGFGLISTVALFLYACGGGGGGGGSSSSTTPITTAAQGSQAASSGAQGARAGTGISDLASSIGSAAGSGALGIQKPMNPLTKKSAKYMKMIAMNNKVAHSKAMQKVAASLSAAREKASYAITSVSQTGVACADGGTFDFTGTFDDQAKTFDLTMTFADCRDGGSQTNGKAHMTATVNFDQTTHTGSAVLNFTLGDSTVSPAAPFEIQDYQEISGNKYANLVGVFSTTAALSENDTFSSAGSATFTLTATGDATFNDFTTTTTINFAGFKDEGSFDTAAGTFNDKLNGGITESETKTDGTHSVAVTFTDFAASVTTSTSNGDFLADVSYSGTVKIDFTPDADCPGEGTFSVATTTPLHYVNGDACPVAGHLVINGNTNVVFNSDKSVDVTVGTDTTHFNSCDGLFQTCKVEDFQGGSTNSGSGSSASGNGMLVTLTWEDDAGSPTAVQQSDMDLHVGYYANSTPSTTFADAYVAWHNLTATFGTANAALDFDDTNGSGPEHVTLDSLPAGYYVIAVDSFSLHTSANATVTVTVNIGGTVYTFPTRQFTTEDADGTDPNSWYRVTDIQCASAGSCAFVTPNTSLHVHDATNGGFKPKLKTK